MAFQLGQRAGDYEFIDVVESTRAGVAYKVRNVRAQRFELLRVLAKAAQDDQEKTDRFLREANVHARLAHPNIVTFYDALVLDGQFVITTELLEGVRLSERLELGPLPLTGAVSVVSQALAALSCAQQAGVIHREVTPRNLAVTPDGAVKLTGFNLAKAPTDPQLTQAGAPLGEVYYMSPEQVKASGPLDHRSDLYSLAVVLYEAVTGVKPFESQSQFDVMLAHVNQTPALPSRINPALPPEFDRIMLKALAKDPEDRFQSAEEFQHALGTMTPWAEDRLPASSTLPAEMPVQPPVPAPPPPPPIAMPAISTEAPELVLPASIRQQPLAPAAAGQWGFAQFALLVLATFVVVAGVVFLLQHA